MTASLVGVGTIDDFIVRHLAVGIDDNIDQQIVLQDRIGMLHFRHDVFRQIGERNQLRRAQ